jgi:hypothetical protein
MCEGIKNCPENHVPTLKTKRLEKFEDSTKIAG